MKISSRTVRLVWLSLPVLGTWAGLALFAYSFVIARPGTSAEYWEHLCGIQLPPFHGHQLYSYSGATLPEVSGSLYYYDQLHHEQMLYSVSIDHVIADAKAVQASLFSVEQPLPRSCRKHGRDLCGLYWNGTVKREACGSELKNLRAPISSSDELARLRDTVLQRTIPAERRAIDEGWLAHRLRRGQRVWLTLSFEGLYLTAWWTFVTWTLLSPRPRIPWQWRAALAPLLLFLPYFLGYAPMTFTFGPSGGFVYPLYLVLAALPLRLIPCTNADRFVWALFPRPLSSLTQLPGPPLAASSMACVGPISCVVGGLALVAAVLLVTFVRRRIARRSANTAA